MRNRERKVVERFTVIVFLPTGKERLNDQLKLKWESLKGKSVHDCVRIFLTCTRKWQFFGAKLFKVKASAIQNASEDESEAADCWLAVNEEGISGITRYYTAQRAGGGG